MMRVKEIEKLKNENRVVRVEVSGCKNSLENLLDSFNGNQSNFDELCKEKSYLKNERQRQEIK